MTAEAIATAAALLADLRLRAHGADQPIADLPAACRPACLADAYRIQALLRQQLSARGAGAPVGWKIGCTTPVMQRYLGIPHPCAGTLYAGTLRTSAATLKAADYWQLGLECELAVRLAADLPARPGGHTPASVAPAVAALMTSVEIVEHRFRDFAKAEVASLVADDFFSAGCVLGTPQAPVAPADLARLQGGFMIDGAAGEQGEAAAILGDPLAALAWLADHAAAIATPLQAGQIVTLGSVVKTFYPRAGTRVEACFAGLAPVTLQIL